MTALILIRHGETDWNLEGRYSGQADIPLNATGIHQAQSVVQTLQEQAIDAIYSSDLQRAVATAQPLATATGAPLYQDSRLREIDQGQWEGVHFEEIRRRYHEAWNRRKDHPLEVAPPEGETVGELRRRVLESVHEILARHPDDRVAIVSHGLALALLRIHFTGFPIETVWDNIPENAVPETLVVEVR